MYFDIVLFIIAAVVSIHIASVNSNGGVKKASKLDKTRILRKVYTQEFLIISRLIAASFLLKLVPDALHITHHNLYEPSVLIFFLLNVVLTFIILYMLINLFSKK